MGEYQFYGNLFYTQLFKCPVSTRDTCYFSRWWILLPSSCGLNREDHCIFLFLQIYEQYTNKLLHILTLHTLQYVKDTEQCTQSTQAHTQKQTFRPPGAYTLNSMLYTSFKSIKEPVTFQPHKVNAMLIVYLLFAKWKCPHYLYFQSASCNKARIFYFVTLKWHILSWKYC